MTARALPPADVMFRAFESRDTDYDGVFVTAVRTTGIFCRPTCPARKPKRENVEFFSTVADALSAGYRACLRCRPMEPQGSTPGWARTLLEAVEADPARRWTDQDLRGRQLDPARVRRWFQRNHGITFHAYSRARRLASALSHLTEGEALTQIAHEHGYESLSGFRDAFTRAFGMTPGSPGKGQVVLKRLNTPLGPMVAGANDDGICLLEFSDRRMLETQLRRVGKRFGQAPVPGDHALIDRLEGQLDQYFKGTVQGVRPPLGPLRDAVSGTRLARSAGDPVRRDHQLRRARPSRGLPGRSTRSGTRQRGQPDRRGHPLSPRDSGQRGPGRLRRRTPPEAMATGPGTGSPPGEPLLESRF